MDRKITLSIAPATETHCNRKEIGAGMCPMLHFRGGLALCRAFDDAELKRSPYWDVARLPACLAAEVKS